MVNSFFVLLLHMKINISIVVPILKRWNRFTGAGLYIKNSTSGEKELVKF